MNVLICGGEKTENIVKSLEKRFNTGSIKFITEKDIDDIETVTARGEYFDRAIIIEQSWTNDGTILEEKDIRVKLDKFTNEYKEHSSKDITFIFVVTTENMAKMVLEETLELINLSKVVLKSPPYSVSFFTTLVTSELNKLPAEYLFSMENVEVKSDINELNYGDVLDVPKEVGIDIQEDSQESTDDEFFSAEGDTDDDTLDLSDVDFGTEINGFDFDDNESEEYNEDNNEQYEPSDELEDTINSLDDNINEFEDNTIKTQIEINPDSITTEANKYKYDRYNEVINKKQIDVSEIFSEQIYEKKDTKTTNDIQLLENIEEVAPNRQNKNKVNKVAVNGNSITRLKDVLNTFKIRGNSLVVTGSDASGKTTIAYNLANIIVKLGYTVLLVDLDTKGRGQSYISNKVYEAVHSHDTSNASLKMAINDVHNGIGRYVNIIDPGFHILTMGLAGDILDYNNLADKSKLIRFANTAITNYNYVIYDMPFDFATNVGSDITFMADNILMCVDYSNWGIMKALIDISNIDKYDIQEIIYRRAKICFNKYTGTDRILGTKVRTTADILRRMDALVVDLLGQQPELEFSSMMVVGLMNYDSAYDKCILSKKQYSDYKEGASIMLELLQKILLNKE